MGKLSFLIGIGAGYVAGTRAGRERYELIRLSAQRALAHPAVQRQVTGAKQQIRERGPEAARAAGKAALRGAGRTAKDTAVAGFTAANGRTPGPVVQGRLSEPDPVPEAPVEPVPEPTSGRDGAPERRNLA